DREQRAARRAACAPGGRDRVGRRRRHRSVRPAVAAEDARQAGTAARAGLAAAWPSPDRHPAHPHQLESALGALARCRAGAAIDAEVYSLFGLSRELIRACEQGFWGDRFSEEIQRLDQAMSDPLCSVTRKEGTA